MLDKLRSRLASARLRKEAYLRDAALKRELGAAGTIQYKRLLQADILPGEPVQIQSRRCQYPLLLRPRSSDIEVFYQVFIRRDYGCVDDLPNVRSIVDLGANAGYSAAYFLSRFPNARLIAVEPDADNYRILSRNLAPYGWRCSTLHAGIWSHQTKLEFRGAPYRDGREWARQVQERDNGNIDGIDIPRIQARFDCKKISLLKIDIEGAEAVLFSGDYQRWLRDVDIIVAELHDDTDLGNASQMFFNAMTEFRVCCLDQIVFCSRMTGV